MATRYAIVGNSGSGKSTLAKRLAQQLSVTAIDLDEVYWEQEQPGVPRETNAAARELRHRLTMQSSWVIEGCYESLIEAVLDLQPKLVWLDPGKEQCLQHCRMRPWEPHKYSSPAAQNRNLAMLLDWVAEHYRRDGAISYDAHRALFDRYAGDKMHVQQVADDGIEM